MTLNPRTDPEPDYYTGQMDSDICSRCKEHAVFYLDDVEGELRSACCNALPTPVDVEEP